MKMSHQQSPSLSSLPPSDDSNANSQTVLSSKRCVKVNRSTRRMFANSYPKRSHFNQLWPIHLQQIDRRCAYIREANNDDSTDTPIKVIKPVIALRMKQARFHPFLSKPDNPVGFVSIAGWARKTEVFELRWASERLWMNVFNFESHNSERFTRSTICTALREMCTNPSPEVGRNIVAQLYSPVFIWCRLQ